MPAHRAFTWRSFWRLSDDRRSVTVMVAAPTGGAMMRPIPQRIDTLAIHDWCDRHGIAGDDLHAFRHLIDAMDDAWREETAALAATTPPNVSNA